MLLAYCPRSNDEFYTAIIESLELTETEQMIGAITEEQSNSWGWGDVDDPIIQYEKGLPIRRTDTLEGDHIWTIGTTVSGDVGGIEGWYYLPH